MTTNAVTDGFAADVELLLNRFASQNSPRFECFCTEWSRMNFQYVFCGYMCVSELVQFLDDAFIIMKGAFLNATSHFEKIGALYLMYTMYFKQPPKQYCKFRMTLSDWMKMNQFYNEVCIFNPQTSLVFWKLLQHDAFRFVEAEYEFGFEKFMQKGVNNGNDDNKFRKINPVIQKSLSSLNAPTTGLLPALEILQVGYNEMKEHLNQSSNSMSATTIVTDITKRLDEIGKLFKLGTATEEATGSVSGDAAGDGHGNSKRRKLKMKAFEGAQKGRTASESSPNKRPQLTYRTSVTDDGDFIKIEKAPLRKVENKRQLKERELRTVIKQLDEPIEDEQQPVEPTSSPLPSTSSRLTEVEQGYKDLPNILL